jgi:group I intron endonuclease
MLKISGIYKIQSQIHPDRFYIGSAIQVKSRWCLHLADLKKNKHHASKLQNHYNKYGIDDLVFIIIEPCLPQFLQIREQFYLDTLRPFFNSSKSAFSNRGCKWSDEDRKKQSERMTGKPSPRKGKKGKKMSVEFCKHRSELMKGNKLNEGKHWKWTDEQKDKWLIGDKNPSHRKKLRIA